jgi:hypothetical protein
MAEPASNGASDPEKPKVIVVMPARQAAATLNQTVSEIPLDQVAEIILVDDSSTDDTVELARKLPLEVLWHPHQVGYGGNRRPATCRPSTRTRTSSSCCTPTASTSPG